MLVEPTEKLADASGGHGDAGVSRTVIKVDGIAICAQRVAAGEGDVPDIALAFVRRLGSKNPRVTTQQAVLGGVQIKQRHTEAIETAGGRSSDAVLQYQPPPRGLDERRRQTNAVRIPPGTSTCGQHKLVAAPVAQVR